MLINKIAVVGAQSLFGQEIVRGLEQQHCSVLPLASTTLTREQEEEEIVAFTPTPELVEGFELMVLVSDPPEGLLDTFKGKVLDIRSRATLGNPAPLTGQWPSSERILFLRPAVDTAIATLPSLFGEIAELSGVHLKSMAHQGELGILELHQQSIAVLQGEEPDSTLLGYRAAFELIPHSPRGKLIEVLTPTFHGDLLCMMIKPSPGALIPKVQPNVEGVVWLQHPPTSREIATQSQLFVYVAHDDQGASAQVILGFDAILYGVLRPLFRLLDLPLES